MEIILDGLVNKYILSYYHQLVLKNVDTEKTPYLENVVIDNGILKQGQVDKKVSEPILHTIFNEYGYREATRYLNDLQKVVAKFYDTLLF